MDIVEKITKPIVVLSLLFCIALGIRVYALGINPGGFHEDEAHIGYNAYSLLKTARDKNNVFLPFSIDQFGDFRPAGLHYLTIPSVALLGLNEFATRLPVAIVGSLSIFVIYFLAQEIFQKKSIGLITAALITFNPWHIIASRSTSESIVALFFVLWGAYFLVKLFHIPKLRYIIFASILFMISFLFYHAARYFVPFLLVYFFFAYFFNKKISGKIKIVFIIGACAAMLVLACLFKFTSGSGRVEEISIFTNPATKIMQWYQVSEDGGQNVFLTRFYHNGITDYTYTALSNYFAHFSGDFLFFKGGLPPRYMIPWQGNFYLLDGLFCLVAVVFLLSEAMKEKKYHSWVHLIPLAWLLLGPIPAALTFEDIPHFQRSIMMLPGFLLLAGYGVSVLWTLFVSKIWRTGLFMLLGVFYLYAVLLFMHDYFVHGLNNQPWFRNEGQKDLVMAVDSYTKMGYHVIMTTQNANRLIFYLFFNKVNPSYYQKIGSPRDHDGLAFQNLIFSDSTCPSNNKENLYKYKFPIVFVDAGLCKLDRGRVLKTIKRKDNTPVFLITE